MMQDLGHSIGLKKQAPASKLAIAFISLLLAAGLPNASARDVLQGSLPGGQEEGADLRAEKEGGEESASGESDRHPLKLQAGGLAYHRAFPIVEPDSTHTKLAVSREGLNALMRIKTPVSIVAVIGPYRSGKSFLLNQLLSLPCSEGFGVGHQRETKTKGIWIWGEPMLLTAADGQTTSVLFMDTEGFESIGKSDVYDDRIFALSAILSSVLIYNLPETVKETDIGKLSFATELAEEFYGRVAGRESPFQAAKLLWLIQRDFLEGKTVQAMVDEALRPVANPRSDAEVEHMNAVRQSLNLMAANSTAFGLRQPHLERTKLCDLKDSDLDPKYISQREELKSVVARLAAPKTVQGRPVNGQEFANLLEQMLDALNKGEFPSTASVVDTFNGAVMEKSVAGYKAQLQLLKLPVAETAIVAADEPAAKAALQLFEKERFGRRHGQDAVEQLKGQLKQALEGLLNENKLKSSQLCQETYAKCEDRVDSLQAMRLPSTGKFEHGFAACNKTYSELCLGPSREFYAERLQKLWQREQVQFLKDYNGRLFNWLVVLSLAMVAIARFCLKSLVLEVLAWLFFVFLEVYTRIFFSSDSLYHNPMWENLVWGWEVLVYNPLLDLDAWIVPLVLLCMGWCIHSRWFRNKARKGESLLPSNIKQVKGGDSRRKSRDSPNSGSSPMQRWTAYLGRTPARKLA